MTYDVRVMPSAARELDEAYAWFAARTENAAKWYDGLLDAVLSLGESPLRYPLYSHREKGDETTRQLRYGDKRNAFHILFEVRGNTVIVLHIRHAARSKEF